MNPYTGSILWFSALLMPVLAGAQTASAPVTPNAFPGHNHSMASSTAHSLTLSVLVDGKNNPELIPDDLAYRHFVMALSAPRIPSLDESRRRESLLQPLNFTSGDHDALIGALAGVKENLDALNKTRDTVTGRDAAASSKLLGLRDQERALLDEASNRMRSTLSPQGLIQFEAYLRDHVKKHIVIYGNK